jgi:hypothetical protein
LQTLFTHWFEPQLVSFAQTEPGEPSVLRQWVAPAPWPSQSMPLSQTPGSVPRAGTKLSAGHAAPPPGQVSATSHAPAYARHTVPAAYIWHAPAPSHMPLFPQLAAPASLQSLSGSVPVVTGAQVPSVPPVFAAEHAMQVPVHAVLQQTPSTQLPFVHSALAEHVAPSACFGTQAPLEQ